MPSGGSRRRVLVVDDGPRMTRFIRLNLEQLRDQLPDMVLLDVLMPDIDGFETLTLIREISNVPVIMLTARGDEEDRIRGLELGADDYITKPFSPRELVSRGRAVLRRAQLPRPRS